MATKSVTLKDSNGDTLYPVTDSNVVNISQQKTLAQALDGVVYAEDPTQSATPTAWVTSGDIDWTTMPGSYSTTEQKTPFVWIDGKHIYKKTVDFGNLPNNTGKSVAHGITGISRVVKIEAIMHQGANSWVIPYTSVTSISVEGSNVVIYTNTNLTGLSAFVTAYYTKS